MYRPDGRSGVDAIQATAERVNKNHHRLLLQKARGAKARARFARELELCQHVIHGKKRVVLELVKPRDHYVRFGRRVVRAQLSQRSAVDRPRAMAVGAGGAVRGGLAREGMLRVDTAGAGRAQRANAARPSLPRHNVMRVRELFVRGLSPCGHAP